MKNSIVEVTFLGIDKTQYHVDVCTEIKDKSIKGFSSILEKIILKATIDGEEMLGIKFSTILNIRIIQVGVTKQTWF
jgi:hypothetical protein